jgi:hypothetical protein
MKLPDQLLVDKWQFTPNPLTRGVAQLTARIHISDTCGRSVAGAHVWANAIPYNQTSEEQGDTAADGWITLTFQILSGYPANPGRQSQLTVLIRGTTPGGDTLAGTSTRRVVGTPVRE